MTDANEASRRTAEPKAAYPAESAGALELHGRAFDPEAVAGLCRHHHISRLLVYGSILRDDFGPESDVDMLVEFRPGHTPGFEFIGIQDELASLLGRAVDLGTPAGLSKYIRDRVLGEARQVYVR